MPPSITFWNRLEPHPRVNSIAESLAAPVRDPLWLLARQWQMGEFAACDCGSPVYIDLQAQAGPFAGWAVAGGAASPWAGAAPPLEAAVESEPFTPDLATRVELGQWFESLLGANAGPHMIDDLRAAYPLPLVPDTTLDRLFSYAGSLTGLDAGSIPQALLVTFQTSGLTLSSPTVWTVTAGSQWLITEPSDHLSYAVVKEAPGGGVYRARDGEALRFLRVCAGRAADGVALAAAARAGAVILQPRAEWTAPQIQALADAGRSLAAAVRAVYGGIGAGDPPAWTPNHLSFELTVAATNGAATLDTLAAVPGDNGEFDWTSFDLAQNGAMAAFTAGPMINLSHTLAPGHVRFRGMPNARWWEFETGQTDFGDVQPEKRDIAKLIFMDFMLIHGDDWYLAPLEVPIGAVASVTGLYVHDVFGIITEVDRADANLSSGGIAPACQWTMFSPSWIGQAPNVASYLVVPPSAWATSMSSPAIEEVRLLRDPVADMVWGVEATVESGVGKPWSGRERDLGAAAAQAVSGAPGTLRYRLHSPLPLNWIPFVPAPQAGGQGFTLSRALLPGDVAGSVAPAGRILRTTQLREQEVSTEGTIIKRVISRSRWIDGSTHLWISRRRSLGLGQGSAGLRFDLAI
jgi:hypothetical protein